MNTLPISAIILAAGEGKRVGQAKWKLLVDNDHTFLSTIVTKLILAKIHDIVCVARTSSIPVDARIRLAINPKPEYGMFSSIYCGIHEAPLALGYLIFPVDHPYVEVETLTKLVNTFIKYPDQIICPEINNKPGHPIIISRQVAQKITFADYPGGLKKFLSEQEVKFISVEVPDKNILRNVNYLGD